VSAIQPLQPFRWFGSKTRVANQILSLVPPGKHTWLELFAGSGIVTIVKPPHPQEHLNDLDGDVFNVFNVLRDEDESVKLVRAISLTPYCELEFLRAKYEPQVEDPIERARRFLVLSWQGQGGVSRHKTGFRFSFALNTDPAKAWENLDRRLQAIAARLRRVTIWSRPALEIFDRIADCKEAVVFADPPYPSHTISSKARYRVDMTHDEHVALADAFKAAKCTVILTMNPGSIYEEVLKHWQRFELKVRGSKNEVKIEYLFTNGADFGFFNGVAL
jgi:DNA adenine methylase